MFFLLALCPFSLIVPCLMILVCMLLCHLFYFSSSFRSHFFHFLFNLLFFYFLFFFSLLHWFGTPLHWVFPRYMSMVQRLSHVLFFCFTCSCPSGWIVPHFMSLVCLFCRFFFFRFLAIFYIFVFSSSMLHWFSTPVVGCLFFFLQSFSGTCLWFRDIVMCLFDMLMVQRHDHVFFFSLFSFHFSFSWLAISVCF